MVISLASALVHTTWEFEPGMVVRDELDFVDCYAGVSWTPCQAMQALWWRAEVHTACRRLQEALDSLQEHCQIPQLSAADGDCGVALGGTRSSTLS